MTLITLGLACPHLGRRHRWLAGIAIARWLEPPLPTLGLLALPPLAALFLWRREPGPCLAAACALALLAGGVRTLWATPHSVPDDLATYNDQGQVTLVGVVVDEPDVRDTYQNLRLRAESVTMESVGAGLRPAPTDSESAPDMRPVRGLVLVQAPRYPARAYGERLAVSGELETPPVFEDFSYKNYLARQGVYSMLRRPRIELIETGQAYLTKLLCID
jgi:hypothetical protein